MKNADKFKTVFGLYATEFVKDPETGKWRCFSSVTDDWITDWMSKREYQEWRYKEYGRGCGPLFRANMMDLDEAERRIQDRESWEQ